VTDPTNDGEGPAADPVNDYLSETGGPSGPGVPDGAVLAGLTTMAAELGELRRRVVEQGERFGPLGDRVDELADLAAEVAELAAAVAELTQQEKSKAPRPVDLAHIPASQMPDELQGLVEWSRDVLFAGWPDARRDIRSCWPRHVELVNAMLWLRTTYETAYVHEGGRSHHAADFFRCLADVRTMAATLTRGCPRPGESEPHAVPVPLRDDLPALAAAGRTSIIAQTYRLTMQAKDPEISEDIRAEARGRVRQMFGELRITKEEYEQYERALKLSEKTFTEAAYTARDDQADDAPTS
jgi:hypothetical protein